MARARRTCDVDCGDGGRGRNRFRQGHQWTTAASAEEEEHRREKRHVLVTAAVATPEGDDPPTVANGECEEEEGGEGGAPAGPAVAGRGESVCAGSGSKGAGEERESRVVSARSSREEEADGYET
uniref:Uncharacterized protein n=1 Tax=Oryza barthii TaxID=65489 RepID=A0A0D3HLM3_9ORYZ